MATVTAARKIGTVEAAIITDDGKKITCSKHGGGGWCNHLVEMFSTPFAHDATDLAAIDTDTTVTVPLIPTEDRWANVLLSPANAGMLHVFVEDAKPEHIGMLAEGEGRYAIRLMMFEWLRFKWNNLEGWCSNPAHAQLGGRPAYNKKTKNRETGDGIQYEYGALADLYDVLTKGICTRCSYYSDASLDVPEV